MNFLRKEDFYKLMAEGRFVEAEELASDIEGLLRHGEWEAVDGFLNDLDPYRLTPVCCLVLLTFAWHARNHLKERAAFLRRCEGFLKETLGEERAENLLRDRR